MAAASLAVSSYGGVAGVGGGGVGQCPRIGRCRAPLVTQPACSESEMDEPVMVKKHDHWSACRPRGFYTGDLDTVGHVSKYGRAEQVLDCWLMHLPCCGVFVRDLGLVMHSGGRHLCRCC